MQNILNIIYMEMFILGLRLLPNQQEGTSRKIVPDDWVLLSSSSPEFTFGECLRYKLFCRLQNVVD